MRMPSKRQTWRWYQLGKARAPRGDTRSSSACSGISGTVKREEAGQHRPAAKGTDALCRSARHAFFAGFARTP